MLFDHPEFDNHEEVLYCYEPSVGLRAIIALHSTAIGPAAGGCRMHPYASEEEALTDVLRLSKAMTYKNAVAGLPLGGGKCLIIADPKDPNKPELLRAFATYVQSLNGRYWTAIDIGVSPADADILAERCDYIFARASQYKKNFNASAFTALGGLVGIKAVAEAVLNRNDVKGLRVAVQGLGATGYALSKYLYEAGATLTVTDLRNDLVDKAVVEFGAHFVKPDRIHAVDVDVFAPCAMGAVLTDKTIPEIRAKVVCGLANNQLAEERHGKMLNNAGIVYVPDFVVNAGGMMVASTIIFSKFSCESAVRRIDGLRSTIQKILERARAEGRASADVANDMALEKIEAERPG